MRTAQLWLGPVSIWRVHRCIRGGQAGVDEDRNGGSMQTARSFGSVGRAIRSAGAGGESVRARRRPVGPSRMDVLYYLDMEICQNAVPRFLWMGVAAVERVAADSREPWKAGSCRSCTPCMSVSAAHPAIRDLGRSDLARRVLAAASVGACTLRASRVRRGGEVNQA
jgi:hypothetical protein